MQYVCLVYNDEAKIEALTDAELEGMVGECIAFTHELERTGHHVMSSGLQSSSGTTIIRGAGSNPVITDGPFAETKEVLGGFTIIEARDLNEAIQIASRFPTGKLGSIHVRPVMDPSQEYTNAHDRKVANAVRGAIQSLAVCP